ncbi:alpha/beta hydrolase [Comamonas piscis]|uniref:Alpha/beta hydrolase n=1 Tax=Comamonas piscis TaxID=1562974 RepID=A0A7G5ELS3_9BURK|nr:alpha/beta hydrolase [Comamonas piscis]QMV74948.1 alpha/beta hydrolase [Comamonas piscis]WSO33427.1 alpha/beta hydrolase [Comamonas piscis]
MRDTPLTPSFFPLHPLGWVLASLAVLLLVVLALAWMLAGWLAKPYRQQIGAAPAALGAVDVEIASAPGVVRGWYAPGKPGEGAVLLLHGVRADRRAMLPRAPALQARGQAVLLIDLPAHGESDGDMLSFGPREGLGIAQALAWLQAQQPTEKVGVVGVSLGGASLLIAELQQAPDAVVLEGVFPTMRAAVDNRVRAALGPLAPLARIATPLLLWQMPLRLGVDPQRLRPIDRLSSLRMPVLVAGGMEDRYTTEAETRQMAEAATDAPHQLWLVPGAAHEDLYQIAPQAYEAQVLAFLREQLQAN